MTPQHCAFPRRWERRNDSRTAQSTPPHLSFFAQLCAGTNLVPVCVGPWTKSPRGDGSKFNYLLGHWPSWACKRSTFVRHQVVQFGAFSTHIPPTHLGAARFASLASCLDQVVVVSPGGSSCARLAHSSVEESGPPPIAYGIASKRDTYHWTKFV